MCINFFHFVVLGLLKIIIEEFVQNIGQAIRVVFSVHRCRLKYLQVNHNLDPLCHILLLEDLDIFHQIMSVDSHIRRILNIPLVEVLYHKWIL